MPPQSRCLFGFQCAFQWHFWLAICPLVIPRNPKEDRAYSSPGKSQNTRTPMQQDECTPGVQPSVSPASDIWGHGESRCTHHYLHCVTNVGLGLEQEMLAEERLCCHPSAWLGLTPWYSAGRGALGDRSTAELEVQVPWQQPHIVRPSSVPPTHMNCPWILLRAWERKKSTPRAALLLKRPRAVQLFFSVLNTQGAKGKTRLASAP